MKKLIYICSPLRGNYEVNIDNAIEYSGAAFRLGYIPITPHIYFTRFANDANSKERDMAMNAGFQLLLMCSEVWVFGIDHPSEGMQEEIALAVRHEIPIKDGEKMLADHHRKKAGPVMTEDIVERHVEWLTKNYGPAIAARWKRTNEKYAGSGFDRKLQSALELCGCTCEEMNKALEELSEILPKGVSL